MKGGASISKYVLILGLGAILTTRPMVSRPLGNAALEGPDGKNMLLGLLLRGRITLRRIIVFDDFGHLLPRVRNGKIQYREEDIDGLEQGPEALIGRLRGDAFAKRVVKLSG